MSEQANVGLDERLTVRPAGGLQTIHYKAALLTSERLNILVLFGDEKVAKATRADLVKDKLIRSDNVVFVGKAFEPSAKADIEDLLDPAVYEKLIPMPMRRN